MQPNINFSRPLLKALVVILVLLTDLLTPPAGEARIPDSGGVGRYVYWEGGINLTGPRKKFGLLGNFKIDADIGSITADNGLRTAFPDLDDKNADFRRLKFALMYRWLGLLEGMTEIDLSDMRSIKDNWVRFTGNETLRHFIFGHVKEPFSLENLTSSSYTSFMEISLPTAAFSPGRNIGMIAAGNKLGGALTWSFGYFFNTGSLSLVGQSEDRISDANGVDMALRFTALPQYENDGQRLTHLGFSWSHGFRDGDRTDPNAEFKTRPESRLTDERLVDTGNLINHWHNLLGFEAAWINGPLSFTGEYFYVFMDSTERLNFSGWYLAGSYILTGETRSYRKNGGVFGPVQPTRSFQPSGGAWGALELAMRYSTIDLNDKSIRGGEEHNLTCGFNWYFKKKIRFMVNYIFARVRNRGEPPVQNSDADILMARFQVRL